MRICLATADPHVITTVQSVAPEVSVQTDLNSELPAADLYIWDCDLTTRIPHSVLNHGVRQQLLLLFNPKCIASLEADLLARSCALLKPINSFTVRAFLELAAKTWELSQKANRADELHSDREALMEYVLATNLRLQEYDHHRTNFLARALHDIRAPITALQGYCGLLADGQLGPVSPVQRELFSRMQISTRRLSKQAAGMFELTVLGHVRGQPQWTIAEIDDAVSQAVHEIFLSLQDKDQNISVSLDAPDKPFHFDSEQIGQTLLNLLENCCKFAPSRGSVEIRGYNVACDFTDESTAKRAMRVQTAGTGYRIDIEDNGPGIQTDLLASIFEQYTPYSAGRDRSGGGLGLAISKMIVTAHQGFIWADNSQNGAVFSLVLPFQPSKPCSDPSSTEEAAVPNLLTLVRPS
jgi:signal transduction histidine kinase